MKTTTFKDGNGALQTGYIADENGLVMEGAPSDYLPRSSDASQGGGSIHVDPDGNLNCRAAVLTDEGGYRVNFANASLGISLGNCTFVNGSTTVTGTFTAPDLHIGDYVKLDADGESAWAQIEVIDSLSQLTLTAPYTGTSATGATSRTIVAPVTGSGDVIAVASGVLTITKGTTSGAVSGVERTCDVLPIGKQTGVTISQRIANQDTVIGLVDDLHPTAPWWYVWFRFTGTTNTVVLCESGFNPSGVPSASEVESQSVTFVAAGTSATSHRYRVEVLQERVRFFIDGLLVKELFKVVPHAYNVMRSVVRCTNTGVPASATTVTVDYDTVKNENRIAIGGFSEQELIRVTSDGIPNALGQQTSALSQPVVMSSDQRGMTTASPLYVRISDGTNVGQSGDAAARAIFQKLTDGTNGPVTVKAASTAAAAADLGLVATLSPNLPAQSLHTLESAATTNATSVKTSAGSVKGLVVTSPLVTATVRYLKLYNKASAPTVGTDIPVMTFPIVTTTNGVQNPILIPPSLLGLYFTTGIAYAITGGATTADTTAVAAGDVKVFMNYV